MFRVLMFAFAVLVLMPGQGKAVFKCVRSGVIDGAPIFDVLDDPQALRQALADGADPNAVSTMERADGDAACPPGPIGDTPVFRAAYMGQLDSIRILLQAGASTKPRTDDDDPIVFHGAVTDYENRGKDALAVVRILLDHDPDLIQNAASAMVKAVQNQDPALLRELLDRGADPNRPDPLNRVERLALPVAARDGYVEMVKLLLAHGADPNAHAHKRPTPLIAAISAKPAANNSAGRPPIVMAMLDLLLANGADVNCIAPRPGTIGQRNNETDALSVAVQRRSIPMIERLLAAGPNTHILRQAMAQVQTGADRGDPTDATIARMLMRAMTPAPPADSAGPCQIVGESG